MEMAYCVEKAIPHSQWLSWSDEDRAKHTAYWLEQASTCQLCGTAEWEWEENKFAYEPAQKFCRGCYLKAQEAESAGNMPGTTVELNPVTPEYRARMQVIAKRRAKMETE